ncbi:GNAT family N-acetyltransferase [Vibrio mediterranei]|uniref:GNAT family N-acetyltransferase n=1 Tax=Vibrio mediterranei TaxID=689 RepID=UPI000D182FC8|nr:N-acetyltransferase [Vibrio mediterranei]PTC06507.1 GNAT family N-acetyltransferase [Vibrio mediterranei]
MKIRTETHEDIKQIHSITYQAFENHPHHEPGAKPTEHLIVDGLRRDNALTVSLVCEANNEVIGHIAFSPILIDGEASTWVGLGPVSVIPEHQGKGIGGALIREGEAQIKQLGYQGIVLLGDPSYYGRFGFESHPNLTFADVPAEYFLVKGFENTIPKGEVTYHKAFFETA